MIPCCRETNLKPKSVPLNVLKVLVSKWRQPAPDDLSCTHCAVLCWIAYSKLVFSVSSMWWSKWDNERMEWRSYRSGSIFSTLIHSFLLCSVFSCLVTTPDGDVRQNINLDHLILSVPPLPILSLGRFNCCLSRIVFCAIQSGFSAWLFILVMTLRSARIWKHSCKNSAE